MTSAVEHLSVRDMFSPLCARTLSATNSGFAATPRITRMWPQSFLLQPQKVHLCTKCNKISRVRAERDARM